MIVINKTSNRDTALNTESLKGVTFNRENKGHKFVISCMRGGVLEPVSGTVTGYFMRSNNTTCRVEGTGFTGVDADGRAWIILPQDCYNVAGRFKLSIYVSHSGVSECIYSCIGTVERSDVGEVIDSGVPLPTYDDIADMYQEMGTAVTNANNAAAFVPNVIAPAYASGTAYSAGDYFTDSGKLYRVTADITAANNTALSAVSKTQVTMGAELGDFKSALKLNNLLTVEDATVDGVTLTNLDDGLVKFNGTASHNTDSEGVTLPAGTYTLKRAVISGSTTATGVAVRFGLQESGSTAWNNYNAVQTFESDTNVFLRVGSGTYTDYVLSLVITRDGEEYTAIDLMAREKANRNSGLISSLTEDVDELLPLLDDVDDLSELIDQITEQYNLFHESDKTVKGCTLTNNADGSITLTGTATSSADFDSVTLPAGTYTLKRTNISGSTTGVAAIRYTEGSTTKAWTGELTRTFNSETRVFLRAGSGTYTDYKVSFVITKDGSEYTAIDLVARNKEPSIDPSITTRISNLETDVTALNAYKLPANMMSKYNVYTCVDKTSVKMDANSVVIAFGDSITYGAGANGRSWVNILADKFGFTLYKKAITGATYGHERSSGKWISTQLENTTDAQFTAATLVVFAAGTNDAGTTDVPDGTSYADIKTYVQSAITYVRGKNATVPILFITPIKRGTESSNGPKKIPYISGIIENVALQNGCSVICGWDFPIPSVDEGEIDGLMDENYIHPNSVGQQIYAQSVINAIM